MVKVPAQLEQLSKPPDEAVDDVGQNPYSIGARQRNGHPGFEQYDDATLWAEQQVPPGVLKRLPSLAPELAGGIIGLLISVAAPENVPFRPLLASLPLLAVALLSAHWHQTILHSAEIDLKDMRQGLDYATISPDFDKLINTQHRTFRYLGYLLSGVVGTGIGVPHAWLVVVGALTARELTETFRSRRWTRRLKAIRGKLTGQAGPF